MSKINNPIYIKRFLNVCKAHIYFKKRNEFPNRIL